MKKAVVIIHGFAGSLSDNEYLQTGLELTKKYDCYAFTLKGHDMDMIRINDYNEWLTDFEEKLKPILKKYRQVYLIGDSMGGVIASIMATKYPIKKLVLAAPAFDYLSKDQITKDIFETKEKIDEKEVGNTLYSLLWGRTIRLNIKTLMEFTKLVKNSQHIPEQINIPTLIIHGKNDEIVPFKSSEELFDKINIDKKYLIPLENIRHQIFKTDQYKEINDIVNQFLIGGRKWKLKQKLTK